MDYVNLPKDALVRVRPSDSRSMFGGRGQLERQRELRHLVFLVMHRTRSVLLVRNAMFDTAIAYCLATIRSFLVLTGQPWARTEHARQARHYWGVLMSPDEEQFRLPI